MYLITNTLSYTKSSLQFNNFYNMPEISLKHKNILKYSD